MWCKGPAPPVAAGGGGREAREGNLRTAGGLRLGGWWLVGRRLGRRGVGLEGLRWAERQEVDVQEPSGTGQVRKQASQPETLAGYDARPHTPTRGPC